MKTICKGNDSEIWGIDTSGKHIMVDDAGTVLTLDVPGLVSAQTLHSMRLSPEGDRIAFSIESDGGSQSGVAIIGICRDHDGSVAGLSQAFALVSTQSNVSMMTFYNDVTFLYATQYERGRAQIGRRQMVPGPETSQALPDNGAVDMYSTISEWRERSTDRWMVHGRLLIPKLRRYLCNSEKVVIPPLLSFRY